MTWTCKATRDEWIIKGKTSHYIININGFQITKSLFIHKDQLLLLSVLPLLKKIFVIEINIVKPFNKSKIDIY